MPINFFGEESPEPAKVSALRLTPKPPAEPKAVRIWPGNPKGLRMNEMDAEDKRLYARESKKAQHRREAEEQDRIQKTSRESEERAPQEEYSARQLQEGIPYPTLKQEMEIQAEAIKLAEKILSEVGKDPDVDRIDEDTVRTVAALNFGFAKGYVEPNKSGLHVAFRFVDLSMADCITAVHNPKPSRIPRYDRPWQTSPAFLDAYRKALKQSLDICDKFPNLVERNYVISIRDEWNEICGKEIDLALGR